MAPGRRSKEPEASGEPPLGRRVGRLELRVDDLDRRVVRLEDVVGPPPEPEPPAPPEEEATRCPGCRLPVEDPSARRCVWCGFVFSAAPGLRKRRRGR